MTPEQLREAWDRFNATVRNKVAGEYGPFTNQHWADICAIWQAHADALEEIGRLKKENDTLRGLLGNSAKPCPYCGLAAEDQAKCASGFPGCARADDQQLSSHFADAYRAERAEAALAECRSKLEVDPRTKYDGIDCRDETIRSLDERLAEAERKCARLRFHAEAMARDLDDWSIYAGCPSNVAKAYRDEFKEES